MKSLFLLLASGCLLLSGCTGYTLGSHKPVHLRHITKIAVPAASTLIDARITKLYGPTATAVPTTNAAPLPTSTIAQLPIGSQMPAAYMQQATSSKLPMILVGAGVAGLLAVWLITRKKKR